MPAPKTMIAGLRARFLLLDLRGKIAAALIVVFLLVGALFALASYLMMRAHLVESTQELLDARAQLERREIELKLEALLAEAASLAGNTATANALADSLVDIVVFVPTTSTSAESRRRSFPTVPVK